MRIFLDTNVFADMLLERSNPEDNKNALMLLKLAGSPKFEFCISPMTVATSFYLLRKNPAGIQTIKQRVSHLTPVGASPDDITFSLSFDYPDREDALQMSCAWNTDCELILTRNPEHFRNSPIPYLNPAEFLERIG